MKEDSPVTPAELVLISLKLMSIRDPSYAPQDYFDKAFELAKDAAQYLAKLQDREAERAKEESLFSALDERHSFDEAATKLLYKTSNSLRKAMDRWETKGFFNPKAEQERLVRIRSEKKLTGGDLLKFVSLRMEEAIERGGTWTPPKWSGF